MIHLLILLAIYFLPAIIASHRHAADRTGILMLNLFLGWTFIGWVIALIWAIAAAPEFMYYPRPPYPPYYR